MPNITQIPAPRVPVIDEKTGLMSREWYRFFINLFNLTGDGTNTISLTDLQVGPPSLDGFAFNTTSYADLAPPVIPAQPAGSNTQVQFNNGGSFGASANFTYVTGTNTFTVGPAGATTTIETLAPTGATVAGTLLIRGKNASATNGDGGGIVLTAGNALGTGTGGSLSFNSGASNTAGIAGDINFQGGAGKVQGGSIGLTAGNGTTNGDGGSFVMTAGAAAGIGASGGFSMLAGDNFFGSGPGGAFYMQSGYSGTGVGGDFRVGVATGSAGSGTLYFGTDSNTDCFTITESSGVSQMGFFNTAPVAQAAAYTKTYATASRVIPNATFTNLVTTAATNVAPYGFATAAQADAIATKVNALAADVLILKQLIVSLVNDSSTTLGVGLNAT